MRLLKKKHVPLPVVSEIVSKAQNAYRAEPVDREAMAETKDTAVRKLEFLQVPRTFTGSTTPEADERGIQKVKDLLSDLDEALSAGASK